MQAAAPADAWRRPGTACHALQRGAACKHDMLTCNMRPLNAPSGDIVTDGRTFCLVSSQVCSSVCTQDAS